MNPFSRALALGKPSSPSSASTASTRQQSAPNGTKLPAATRWRCSDGASHNVDTDLDAGPIAAVLIHSTILDRRVWLVVDAFALAEHPEIAAGGFPVFFFDEVEHLRGKSPEELRAIAMVKCEFPTSRVLQ